MKKITAFVLVISLLLGSFSVAVSAKTDAITQIGLRTARNIATFYLATLEPVSLEAGKEPFRLGENFELTDIKTLYNAADEAAFYNFGFESTEDDTVKGYITVSVNADLPFVMDQKFSPSPFSGADIVKTYYISPLVYFNKMADGTCLNQAGEQAEYSDIQSCFNAYNEYRTGLYAQNYRFVQNVADENAQTLSAIKEIKSAGLSSPFSFQSIYDYILNILYYYIDSVWHMGNITQTNAAVENIIKTHAGDGYAIVESSVVDKNYMVPQYQRYYETNVGGGICGKASSMMALAFYRDGWGYILPDDKAMYAELSAVYDEMTEHFSFFFANPFVSDEMGLSESYEMLGTLDMGLAYYLYSKGYADAAQNVIDNACFSITMVPDAVSYSLMKVLRTMMSGWLVEKTGGALTFETGVKTTANDVIVNTIMKGEPVVIGCLTAIGCDWYSNHYFAGVGYFKLTCDVKLNDIKVFTLNKEYVEVYDTWGHDSSVMNWSVFKSTALYSSTSLADAG